MKKLLFVTLLTLVVAFVPLLVIRGDLWLASDFLHQEIPFILETKRMLATGAPWWSWNTYLGADFIGCYAFYTLTSPFVWINCLFPEPWVPYSIAITFVLKFLCMTWLSWLYLRKMGVSRENSALGSFLFTFSSFNIASLYYYHFYEPIIAFVLLLIAIERLLRHERWGMTCVAMATFLVVFINFYFAVSSLLCALIYVIFRAFSSEINFNFKIAVKGLAAVSVGLVMCAFLLLPIYSQMLLTTRTQAQNAFDHTVVLNLVERFRTLFMPKVVEGTTVFVPDGSASYSNEACIAVFGLSLAAVYVARKRDWLSALALTLVVLYLTPLNGLFTLFTNPLYSRWAYFLTLVIVLCTVQVLDSELQVKRGVVVYCVVASAVVLAFVVKVLIGSGFQLPGIRFVALIVLFFIGIIAMLMWCRGKLNMHWLKIVVACCVVGQMWLFLLNLGTHSQCFNAVRDVEMGDDNVQSRTDFRGGDSFLVFNAGLLRNHASVQGYHSVMTPGVDSLFKTATRNFWATNKLRANVHLDDFNALLSVRQVYIIDSLSNVVKRKASHFIPFGFTYDSYITRSELNKIFDDTTRNLPRLMLSQLVIEDNDAPAFINVLKHGKVSPDSCRRVVATRFSGDSRGYKAHVALPSESVVFFSVPYSGGFTAQIDGKEVPIYKANLCMQALIVPQGSHSIAVKYFPPGLKTGAMISVAGLLLLLMIVWHEKRM